MFQTQLLLPYSGPISQEALLGWFRTRAIPGLEVVTENTYARTLQLRHGAGVCTLRFTNLQDESPRIDAEFLLDHEEDLEEATFLARRLFDLDADVQAIEEVLLREPILHPSIVQHPGIRIPGLPNLTETMTRSILGQQITVTRARNLVETLVHALGDPLPTHLAERCTGASEGLRILFPRAEVLAVESTALVRGPAARTATLQRVSELIARGDLPDIPDPETTTTEQFMSDLENLKGVGPWTSGYAALRLLGAEDLFLSGDVAVISGGRIAGMGVSKNDIAIAAEAFSPYRSYLMMHLWQLSSQPKR